MDFVKINGRIYRFNSNVELKDLLNCKIQTKFNIIMKKFLISFLFILCSTFAFPQSKVEQSTKTRRFYCEIKGTEKELTSGLKIIFDFGERVSYNIWGELSSKLKFVDENGEDIKFNSMVDAANYMVERGWNFQQAFSSVYSNKLIIHWIFYKDAISSEEARKGILTKQDYKKQNK